jgi:hypothetical protein
MIPIRYLCQDNVSYCILSSRFFLVFKSNFVLNFYLPMVMFPQLMHLNTVGFGVTRRLSVVLLHSVFDYTLWHD